MQRDKYFSIRYKLQGRDREEGLGWASEGMTAQGAFLKLSEIRQNQKTGQGPCTLAEMRREADLAREREEAERQAEARRQISLERFWDEDYFLALKNRIKPNSWEKEEAHFRLWLKPRLGGLPLREISDADLERLQLQMRDAGLSPRSEEYILGTFRRIWKHAAKRRIVNPLENPVSKLNLPHVSNSRLRALLPDELRSILTELETTDLDAHDVTVFAAFTGCRASEAFELKWEHVDLVREAALFPETKNREAREVYLVPEIVQVLLRRGPGATGEYVFTKSDGTRYTAAPSAFRSAVIHLGLNEGRPPRERISFHSLRHTSATFAARRGVPVKDLQEIFGWKTPSMVFRYAKGSEDVQRRAMHGLAQALTEERGKVVPFRKTADNS